ncbi:cation:proton antiporter [Nocardia sp. NPDC055002]
MIADPAARLFAALAMVTLLALVSGVLVRRIGQPPVIGEIVAGLLLGPVLLGLLPNSPIAAIFATDTRALLGAIAQVGLVCYMFTVGQEMRGHRLGTGIGRTAVVVLASTAVPMVCGIVLGLLIVDWPGIGGTSQLPLMLGVLLSITAVPVLSRILDERGLAESAPGILSLRAAAVTDAIAWAALAVMFAGNSGGGLGAAPLLLLVFVGVITTVGRVALRRVITGAPHSRSWEFAVIACMLFGCAWATSSIGLHAVFGALLCGVVTPTRERGVPYSHLSMPFRSVAVLLLPVYFLTTGLDLQWNAIGEIGPVLLLTLCVVAFGAKILPAAGAARAVGLGAADSWSVGVLLNTRGLTELVALNIALKAGGISPPIYTILVLVTLLTTLLTCPQLAAIAWVRERYHRSLVEGSVAPNYLHDWKSV